MGSGGLSNKIFLLMHGFLRRNLCKWPVAPCVSGGVWGLGLGWVKVGSRLVLDWYAKHRALPRNSTKGKKGCHNYTFDQILTKNRGQNTTLS